MKVREYIGRSLAATGLALLLAVGAGQAQQAAKEFEPQVGQAGKDVIWVPTSLALINRMLDAAQVTPQDFVVDLGSGDGRTVVQAAKRGAKAMGIEYNPDMVALSRRNAQKEGVSERATFVHGDIFATDFSQATVVTMFLLSDLNLRLRPTILDMKPGTRVASNTFDMGDWEADEKLEVKEGCTSYCRGYFWIVPAKVEGTWKAGDSEITLKQTYQMVSGQVKTGNVVAPISAGRLKGDQITFTAGGTTYTGKVTGNRIEGTAGSAKLEATRG
jgi:SAM-dependent methyltransferase